MTILWSRWLGRVKQGRGKAGARKRPRILPFLEALEERYVPSFYTVTGTADGTGAVVTAGHAGTQSDPFQASTLRAAVNAVDAGSGGDTILTPAGHYLLTSALSITKSVTIQGAGAATTLLDAQDLDRVMVVSSSAANVTLLGLTLENGNDTTGGAPGQGAQDSSGGAILDNGATNLNIVNSVLTDNKAQAGTGGDGTGGAGLGGAVYQYGGSLSFTGSTVSNNNAYGGAGAVGYGGGLGAGGGVYTVLGQLFVQSSTFSGNQADGGASSSIEEGAGAGEGGAIDYAGSPSGVYLTVTESTFYGNQAQGGANTFGGGEGIGGAGFGGAFYDATSARVTDSTIADNTAMGGAVTEPTGVVEPTIPSFGSGVGGGYYFAGGEGMTVSIGGTIIATNSVSGAEPGVEDVQPQGQLASQGPDVFTTNTITAKFTSLGNNLIGINTQTTDGFANGTDNDQVGGTTAETGIDPLLGLLQNNGGPTDTLAITAASPAHDTGAPFESTKDQRGFARTINGLTDVGAFELDVTPPTATLTAANGVTTAQGNANTTTVVVTYSQNPNDTGVNPASFGTGNITVNNGATVTGFSVSGNVVTYTVQAPDSTWANSPQGTYTISLTAGSVTNNDGTGIVGVPDFGAFTVTVVPVVVPKFFAVAAGSGSSQVNVYNASTGALMTSFLAFGPGVSGVSVAVGDVLGNGTQDIIVGAGPGNAPDVEIIDGSKLNQVNAAGQIEFSALIGGRDFFAFSTSDPTGVNVAVGHVNGLLQPGASTGADTRIDGPLDIILGAGPGGGPDVEVIDGTKLLSNGGQLNIDPTTRQIEFGALIGGRDFFAYAPTFTGGVTVAAGDVNGDGDGDVIVGAGPGGNSEVKVIDGSMIGQLDGSNEIAADALLSDFFAFGSGFTGGASVGFGATASGTPELVVAAESGGGPDVEVIDASKLTGLVGGPSEVPFSDLIGGHDFYAYESSFGGGVSVSVQDVNGDGFPDVIAAPGAGGAPQPVEVIDGSKIAQDAAAGQVASADLVFAGFFPFGPLFSGGVASGAVVR